VPAPESAIAREHIEISIKIKRLADVFCRDCQTYVATYTAGASGQSYQRIEQESGEDFWSIKAWTPPPRSRLKDPDLIITHDRRVKYLVEVKWGSVSGRRSTDMLLSPGEREKMARLMHASAMCRVRGPAVKDGRRYSSPEFPIQRDYWTDADTKFVLGTDFLAMQRSVEMNLQELLGPWKEGSMGFLLADVNARVGKIPSFKEVLSVGE
jgi:hypothetical protein